MRRAAIAMGWGVLTLAIPAHAIEPNAPPPPAPTATSPAPPAAAPAPVPVAPAPPPVAPAPAPPPLEPPPGAADPQAGSPTSAPPQMAGPEEGGGDDDGGGGRFRGGVGGLLGAFFPGGVWQFGPEGRLGYQIDDLMAVYASFGAHAGFRVKRDPNGDSSFHAGAGVFVAPMFEVTLADIFFVGIGPQILYGTFASLETAISGESVGAKVGAFTGVMPGFKIKTGVGFGTDAPDRRKQFTIALDIGVVFGDRYEITSSGNADAGLAVGVLPMLAVGYDAK